MKVLHIPKKEDDLPYLLSRRTDGSMNADPTNMSEYQKIIVQD